MEILPLATPFEEMEFRGHVSYPALVLDQGFIDKLGRPGNETGVSDSDQKSAECCGMQVLRHHGHRLSGQDRRRTSHREQPTTSSTWKASKVWCSDLGELEPPDSVRVKLVII